MRYVLLDSHGASLDSFGEREPAIRAWRDLVQQDPSAADTVALLLCDDTGLAVERVTAADAVPADSR